MIDQIGRFKLPLTFLLVVLLAISLIGWNAIPKATIVKSSITENTQFQSNSAVANVARGQKLFMGNLHFENGGPPCMGCHNIGSNGILGGGALGPDLTDVSSRRSQSELTAILSNPNAVITPVMQPIYTEHPLTAEEQTNLLAFINSSIGQPETNREWLVIGISLVGFMAAVVLIELVFHGRLRGVRKPMVKEALKNNK